MLPTTTTGRYEVLEYFVNYLFFLLLFSDQYTLMTQMLNLFYTQHECLNEGSKALSWCTHFQQLTHVRAQMHFFFTAQVNTCLTSVVSASFVILVQNIFKKFDGRMNDALTSVASEYSPPSSLDLKYSDILKCAHANCVRTWGPTRGVWCFIFLQQ